MEEFDHHCQLQNGLKRRPLVNSENLPGSRRRISRTKRSMHGNNFETLEGMITPRDFFWNYFPVPLDRAPTKVKWLQNSRLQQITPFSQTFKNDIDLFEREIAIYSIQQLYNILKDRKPLFSALSEADEKYENIEQSYLNLEYFLSFQLNAQKEVFIEFLWDLLNHNSGKFNCLNIVGPASSGKTFFVKRLKEAMITSGMIANMNRNSSFPFNNCCNKRLLHWDEPSYEPSALEQLKQLFSGDDLSVNIKYSPFLTIQRTPVIVTANSNVFPCSDAFTCRIQNYQFKQAPFLKDWKNFHPMAIYKLFVKRNFLE